MILRLLNMQDGAKLALLYLLFSLNSCTCASCFQAKQWISGLSKCGYWNTKGSFFHSYYSYCKKFCMYCDIEICLQTWKKNWLKTHWSFHFLHEQTQSQWQRLKVKVDVQQGSALQELHVMQDWWSDLNNGSNRRGDYGATAHQQTHQRQQTQSGKRCTQI